MHIPTTNLDGHPTGTAAIRLVAPGHLLVDEQPVLAVRVIGSRIALVLPGRQVCIAATDYLRACRASADAEAAA